MSPNPGPVQHLDAMGNLTRRRTEEDKAEEIKKKLEKRKIPANEWQFYIKAPESWDFNDTAPSGLSRGTEVILLSPNTITPCWVEKGSISRFIKIRGKLTEVMQAKSEIERFVQEEIPEDKQLVAAHKQAGKKADKLQADLQSTCNALAAMTIEEDECFGDEFFSNLVGLSKKQGRKLMRKERCKTSRTCY